jgi:hypothetical protein
MSPLPADMSAWHRAPSTLRARWPSLAQTNVRRSICGVTGPLASVTGCRDCRGSEHFDAALHIDNIPNLRTASNLTLGCRIALPSLMSDTL